MVCCSPRCKKWTSFSIGALLLVLGIVFISAWKTVLTVIMHYELSVADTHTMAYGMWKKTPIPMFIYFYLYNWTNAEEYIWNPEKVLPEFVQLGPYVFSEVHIKENITYNDNNDTITFLNNRIWHFSHERTVGSLDDKITNINVIAATVAYFVRYKHYIVKRGVNFFMEEKKVNLTVTKTARELLFDGYDDELLDLVQKIHFKGIDIPFKKFAWFAERNNTPLYDGWYNMYNGADNIRKLGRLASWNFSPKSPCFRSYCGMVNGTSGELWYPLNDDAEISVFTSDVCSSVTLKRSEGVEKLGLSGYKYAADESVFDNGTKYPDMACFSSGGLNGAEFLPSGVRNVSACKFGAPAFVSFPHFYLADPYYRNSVKGMKPNKSEHEFYLSLEPKTGIPLEANAAAQINILITKTHGIDIFENVTTVFIPAMWFIERAELSASLASSAKLLLISFDIGYYTGYGFLGIGILVLAIATFLTVKNQWDGGDKAELLSDLQS